MSKSYDIEPGESISSDLLDQLESYLGKRVSINVADGTPNDAMKLLIDLQEERNTNAWEEVNNG